MTGKQATDTVNDEGAQKLYTEVYYIVNIRTVNQGRHDVANRKATCTGMLLTCDNFVTCNTDTLGILEEELKQDDLF